MNEKIITLNFDLGQVCNDILAKCNLISLALKDEVLADIKANVAEPDSPETRSIICRAITEAFGKVKAACQRYLMKGRTEDNNALERIVRNVIEDGHGNVTGFEYETVVLSLNIPNFNVSVTDDLKSCIHKYVVDCTMSRFLQDQMAEKAAEYKSLADGEDFSNIVKDLNARERYTMRRASWI